MPYFLSSLNGLAEIAWAIESSQIFHLGSLPWQGVSHMLEKQPLSAFYAKPDGRFPAALPLSNPSLPLPDLIQANECPLTKLRLTFLLLVPDFYDELFSRRLPERCWPNSAWAPTGKPFELDMASAGGLRE